MRYPDAMQKKIEIRMFDEAELYEGLGSEFFVVETSFRKAG